MKFYAKRIILYVALFFVSSFLNFCKLSTESEQDPTTDYSALIPDTLHSEIINDDFRIYTYVPRMYDSQKSDGYDVCYITDGDWSFYNLTTRDTVYPGFVSLANQLTQDGIIPPCITIGIGYVHENMRYRDYYSPPDTMYLEYGHADMFYQFLRQELIPLVDSRLNTKKENGRILFGNSAGGYFSIYAFLRYDNNSGVVFNKIIASTPRVNHWSNHLLVHAEECYRLNGNNIPVKLFYAFGTTGGELSEEQLNQFVPEFESYGFDTKMVIYEGASHGTVFYPAVTDGLTWLFSE